MQGDVHFTQLIVARTQPVGMAASVISTARFQRPWPGRQPQEHVLQVHAVGDQGSRQAIFGKLLPQ